MPSSAIERALVELEKYILIMTLIHTLRAKLEITRRRCNVIWGSKAAAVDGKANIRDCGAFNCYPCGWLIWAHCWTHARGAHHFWINFISLLLFKLDYGRRCEKEVDAECPLRSSQKVHLGECEKLTNTCVHWLFRSREKIFGTFFSTFLERCHWQQTSSQ